MQATSTSHGAVGEMAPGSILLLTTAALSAASGQLLFKVGAHERHHLVEFFNIHIFVGLCLYALSTGIWIYTLSIEKLVNVFAFTGLTFVLVYLGGVFLLRETLTTTGVGGVLLVLLGLFLIAYYGA